MSIGEAYVERTKNYDSEAFRQLNVDKTLEGVHLILNLFKEDWKSDEHGVNV